MKLLYGILISFGFFQMYGADKGTSINELVMYLEKLEKRNDMDGNEKVQHALEFFGGNKGSKTLSDLAYKVASLQKDEYTGRKNPLIANLLEQDSPSSVNQVKNPKKSTASDNKENPPLDLKSIKKILDIKLGNNASQDFERYLYNGNHYIVMPVQEAIQKTVKQHKMPITDSEVKRDVSQMFGLNFEGLSLN